MFLRALNGYARLSLANLLMIASFIIDKLTLNFATAPGLPTLIAARDGFATAEALAREGSKQDKKVRDEKKKELINQLHIMGNYVAYVSGADRVKAESSGFKFAKTTFSPSAPVGVPTNLRTENGINIGEQKLSFDTVDSAKSYNYKCTPDPITQDSVWKSESDTICSHLCTGLEVGKRYWMMVEAIGINGQVVPSDPILTRSVQ